MSINRIGTDITRQTSAAATKPTGGDFLQELKAVMTGKAAPEETKPAEPIVFANADDNTHIRSEVPPPDEPVSGMAGSFSWFISFTWKLQDRNGSDAQIFQKATNEMTSAFMRERTWKGDPIGNFRRSVDALFNRDSGELRAFLGEVLDGAGQGIRTLVPLLNREAGYVPIAPRSLPLTPVSNLNNHTQSQGWERPESIRFDAHQALGSTRARSAVSNLSPAGAGSLEILDKPMDGDSTTWRFLHIFQEFVTGCMGEAPIREESGIPGPRGA